MGAQSPADASGAAIQSKEINEERLYQYLARDRYRCFIEFAGREDQQVKNGNGKRIDYEKLFDIGDGDESALLQVVLAASPHVIETWDESDALVGDLLDKHQSVWSIQNNPRLKELDLEQARLVEQVRAGLIHESGIALLQKVDSHVFFEFINRKGPQSALHDNDSPSEEGSQSNGRDEKQDEETAFALFFQIMGNALQRAAQRGDKADAQLIPHCTPNYRREQVVSILRETSDELHMNDWAEDAMIGVYHKKNGPQPVPRVEFEPLRRAFWKTIDEGKQRLRETLGDATFRSFAREVDDAFGSGLYKEAFASTTTAQPVPANP